MTRQHPSLETIAALAEGRLGGEEKMSIVDHLSQCKECYALFATTAEFVEEEGDAGEISREKPTDASNVFSGMSRHWLPAAAAALLVIVVAIPITRYYKDPVAQLRKISPRPLEGRLMQFDHAPYRAMRSVDSTEDYELLSIAAKLQKNADAHPTADNLRRLGVAQITLGKTADAVETLSRALALAPDSATILNDLAAAQLAAGLPAEAAEHAARALEIDPDLAEAAFNWALALESVSNRPAAINAWERYLQLDATSEWSIEARARLSRLQAPRQSWEQGRTLLVSGVDDETLRRLASTYPQRVRAWAQDAILSAVLGNEASDEFRLASKVAEWRAQSGDPFLRDLVMSAERREAAFVEGARAYTIARDTSRSRDMDGAAEHFERAVTLLRQSSSALYLSATVLAASNESYRGRGEFSLASLSAIRDRVSSYPSIASEYHWVRGLLSGRSGEHGEALEEFRKGLDYARRSGELEHEAALAALIATELDRVAESAEADRHRAEALRRLNETGASAQRLYVAYSESGLASLRIGRPRLALAFIDTQEALAEDEGDPLLLAESRTARALALRELGASDAAIEMLKTSRSIASGIPTDGLRDRTLAEIDYTAALVEKKRNPQLALTSLTSALARWQKNGWRYHAAAARLALGDVHAALGDPSAAEAEYRAGVAEVERGRGSLNEPQLRLAYFERSSNVFDRLILNLLDQERFAAALTIVERKRARTLLEAASREDEVELAFTGPFEVSRIRASLPPSSVLVAYHLTERGADIWTIQRDAVRYARSAASREEIANSVERFRKALARNDRPAADREGAWLFGQLLAPVASVIANASQLILVPDGVLHSVPFPALISPEKTYLIERWSVTNTPSASFYARSRGQAKAKASAVLLVAQPNPRNLPPLPEARSDVERVLAFYSGATPFIGENLSPRAFLDRAADAHLISFAGHATNGGLVFESQNPDPPRLLTASEIARARLRNHPIVVLAACSTGRGKVRMTEGVDSLATAFLAGGARSVVATLWDLEDRDASSFFLLLHEELSEGNDPSEALRSVQLTMLQSSDNRVRNPAVWAGVFLLGSI